MNVKPFPSLSSYDIPMTKSGIQYFDWQELVHPNIFKKPPVTGFAILFDPRMLITLIRLRERYGKAITTNNWHRGGSFQNRVLRPFGSIPAGGSSFSQHFFGRAADLDVAGMTAEEIRQDVKKHPKDKAFEFITCIEDKVNWFHFDCRTPFHSGQTWSGVRFINP